MARATSTPCLVDPTGRPIFGLARPSARGGLRLALALAAGALLAVVVFVFLLGRG